MPPSLLSSLVDGLNLTPEVVSINKAADVFVTLTSVNNILNSELVDVAVTPTFADEEGAAHVILPEVSACNT